MWGWKRSSRLLQVLFALHQDEKKEPEKPKDPRTSVSMSARFSRASSSGRLRVLRWVMVEQDASP